MDISKISIFVANVKETAAGAPKPTLFPLPANDGWHLAGGDLDPRVTTTWRLSRWSIVPPVAEILIT